jgi:hypothetical protein
MPNYFRYIPKFEYVTRNAEEQIISEYEPVKNLFKKAKLREDIFRDLSHFTKYQIVGYDRPDNVADKVYGDEKLDWVILLANNILNIQEEWPLTNDAFNEYLTSKYGTQDKIFGIHHYESTEVKNNLGAIIVPAGLEVPRNYSVTFYEETLKQMITLSNIVTEVTNYQYEFDRETNKRNIYVLKRKYLNIILNDMDDVMKYKKGGTQYVSATLKRADNIRLYE